MEKTSIFDRFLYVDYHLSASALGMYRICYAGFFLLFGIPNFSWIAQNPDAIFFPPNLSIAVFFDGFPSYLWLQVLSIGICILFLMLFWGLFTKVVSVVLSLLIIIGESFAYSFGKIDHDLIIWLIPLLMGVAGWGNALSLDSLQGRKLKKNPAWPIAMTALLLGFAFFTAGAEKIMGGWLHISTQAGRFYILQSVEVFNRTPLLGSFLLNFLPDSIWEIADYATVFFEVCFLAAVIKSALFRKFVFSALFFHLFIFLSMGITTSWLYIVYLLFIDWDKVFLVLRKSNFLVNMKQILTVKFFAIITIVYIALFIWGQSILPMPAATTVGLLPIISEFANINYYQFFGVTSILAGVTIGIYILCLSCIKS